MTSSVIAYLVLGLSILLAAQGAYTLYLMLYTWAHPDRMAAASSPKEFAAPTLHFTALLPCKNEEAVIADTIRRVWDACYPKELLEVVVVCEHTDHGTIAEAERAARHIDHPNVRVVTFNDKPVNKPHGLNVALRATTHEVVTVFDAEDDVHPDIFNIVNTIMLRDDAAIVQAGVQLMDFRSTWFAVHNVLEYFFWFRSRLHYHAAVGAVPLGGNTVFIKRPLLEQVGGWDEHCLTEDADIGIRLSVAGKRIAVTYDAEHATREETPPSLAQFIKQRTRWNQGFLQVLFKGVWRKLPATSQRLLAGYTLLYPFGQAFTGLLWLPTVVMMFTLKVPVPFALVSLLPLYTLLFQYLVNLTGLWEFAKVYGERVRVRDMVVFTLGFLPYQFLLSLGALRAVYRHVRGVNNWEKTAHTGAHRQVAPAAVSMPAVPANFAHLLHEAQRQLGVERGSVMLLDGDNVLRVAASQGVGNHIATHARVAPGEGVAGWVVEHRRPVLLTGEATPRELRERLKRTDLRSAVVVPIDVEGRTVGVVSLSSTARDLGHDELAWLHGHVERMTRSAWQGRVADALQVA
jgi:glycosyltransferase XagB